jgi:hypothetical protein
MTEVKERFQQGLNTIRTLTGVSQADFDTLKSVKVEALTWTDELIDVFYETLFAHERTAAVFKEGERPMREETLKVWYQSLFDANDDDAFWNRQARIGFAHIRRHVNNEFMIGIAAKTHAFVNGKALETLDPEQAKAVADAFAKILLSVVGLTAENYDVMSQIAFRESTGADESLIDRLIQDSVDDVQKQLED